MSHRISYAVVAVLVVFMATPLFAADSARDLLAAGRIDDAIATLNTRLSSAPADAESANLLCRSYYALEAWDRAEAACKKAVSIDSNNSRYHLWLGRVYGEKADRAGFLGAASLVGKVRDEFQRAVQLDPAEIDTRLDLAEFYIEAPGIVGGGEDKAREQAKTIGKTDPGREHWVYARIAEKKKNPAAAEQEYHQFIDLSKGDAEAWLNLALFLRRQNRLQEMEQAIVKMSQSPMPKLDVLVEGAQMLQRSGRNYPFAVQLLQRYL